MLEDVSRFILGNALTTETLKRMRHEVTSIDPSFKNTLLSARDSGEDIGRRSPVEGIQRTHLVDLVVANAKRAQESARVLEEFAKLPEVPQEVSRLDFEQARFTLYEIEKELTLLLSRQNKLERINGVYVIIDPSTIKNGDALKAAREVVEGGGRVIQLRDKDRDKAELVRIAGDMQQICADGGCLFVINDNVDIASAVNADGVHLGQGDMPVRMARQLLAPDKVIGCTVRSVEQALQAQAEGADYIGVGSMYPSPTKPEAPVVGLETLSRIRSAVTLPIVAIGGIDEANARAVVGNGANGIAVISAIISSEDIETATRRLVQQIS